MQAIIRQIWRTIVPEPGDKNGPLLPMLVGLTVVSGIVDAFSYLELGHIFVANVTGDVLFIAFGLAGAPGFSVPAALTTLGVFFVGAFLGGRLFARFGWHRGRLLTIVSLMEAVLVSASVIVATMIGGPATGGTRYAFIVLLALAMGLQNALAFKLAVPGMTTSVLTMTITGISADSQLAGGSGSGMGTRITSAMALFLGALAGALLVLNVRGWTELLLATAILVAVSLIATVLSRSDPTWVHSA
jgi:uncharacterized membrane protein YoaK (UPF0700 family)